MWRPALGTKTSQHVEIDMPPIENNALGAIVLVHGGFVDGSGWEDVYRILKKDGYRVSIVQNPTTSLADASTPITNVGRLWHAQLDGKSLPEAHPRQPTVQRWAFCPLGAAASPFSWQRRTHTTV